MESTALSISGGGVAATGLSVGLVGTMANDTRLDAALLRVQSGGIAWNPLQHGLTPPAAPTVADSLAGGITREEAAAFADLADGTRTGFLTTMAPHQRALRLGGVATMIAGVSMLAWGVSNNGVIGGPTTRS